MYSDTSSGLTMRFELFLLPIATLLLLGDILPESDPMHYGELHGIITDASGNPIIGVTVLLNDGEMGDMTDRDGRYCFESIPEGKYFLTTHMVGLEPVKIRPVYIPGDSIVQIDLELQPIRFSGTWELDPLTFTDASILIRFDPPHPEVILSDFVLSIIQDYRYEMDWELIGDSIITIGVPEGEFSLCWHFPGSGICWLPLHLKGNQDLELTLPIESDPIVAALGKKVIRTYSGSHLLLLSDFTSDEWIDPRYRLERTCIDRSSWGDDSLWEGGLQNFNVCWDRMNHWRIVLFYINQIVLLRQDYSPSIIELPFPLDNPLNRNHSISREGRFIVVLRSRYNGRERYIMIDVNRGRILGIDPSGSDAVSSESQGVVGGGTTITVTNVGVLFDQGLLIKQEEGHTLICRAEDSSPERLSWDTLAVEMEPIGIINEGSLFALSRDSSLISPSGPSFDTDSFLALCTVSSDGDLSWKEIDPRNWNARYLVQNRYFFDPISQTVLIWRYDIDQIGISSAVTGEWIRELADIEEPYIHSTPLYAPGGRYVAIREAYNDSGSGSVLLYPLDTTEEPVILSGDAGSWKLGSILALSPSGNMLLDLYFPSDPPCGSRAGYLRRRALVSSEGRLLWLGPTRLLRSHNDENYEAISDDGLSFIWSDECQIQICRLVSD